MPPNVHPTTPLPEAGERPATIAQAADFLQCSQDTVRRMIARGELPAYRYGGRLVRIELADLRRLRRPVTSLAQYRQDRAKFGGVA